MQDISEPLPLCGAVIKEIQYFIRDRTANCVTHATCAARKTIATARHTGPGGARTPHVASRCQPRRLIADLDDAGAASPSRVARKQCHLPACPERNPV